MMNVRPKALPRRVFITGLALLLCLAVLRSTLGVTAADSSITSEPVPMIQGATEINYADVRDQSAVLTFAEPILPKEIAPERPVAQTAGNSLVDAENVKAAYRLPDGTTIESLTSDLSRQGSLIDASAYRNGQIWRGTLERTGESSLLLLYIDGTHPSFERDQSEELRPVKEHYLIVYRAP